MRYVLLLLFVLAAVPAIAQENGDQIFSGGIPGEPLRPETVPEKPEQQVGWIDWVLDLTGFIWSTFLELVEWCVYVPAEWLRDLAFSWFCWIMTGVGGYIEEIVPFVNWQSKASSTSYIRVGIEWIEKSSGFFAEIFPFGLWISLTTIWLGVESGLAVVRWIIALIPSL